MPTGPRREPWDRQDHETPKAYAAFVSYRDLPPPDRSVTAAYRARSGRANAENLKPPGLWFQWYEGHAWEERALKYDRAADRKIEAALRARRLKVLARTADLGEGLMALAELGKKLASPFARSLTGPDGEVTVPPTRFALADIARLADTGAKLASLGVGLPTDRASVQDGGQDDAAEMLASAKDDVRRRLADIRSRQELADAAVGTALVERLRDLNGSDPEAA